MVYLSELTLVRATPEQVVASCKRTFVHWARDMKLEEYLERDKIMAQQEQWATWVLVPRNDTTTLDYLCSCETFRRDGAVARPTDTHTPTVVAYGVASVFTPAENRGHGYASHMMRLLHWVLAPADTLPSFPTEWGTPPPEGPRDGRFSALYSDVGSQFYLNCGPTPGSRSGWETTSPVSTSWKADTDGSPTALNNDLENWTLLTREGAYEIWDKDSIAVKDDIASASKATGKITFAFLPARSVGNTSIQRTMKFTSDLKPVLDKFWGVARRTSQDAAGPPAYATWTYEPQTKTIVLTRLRASPEEFPSLLEKLRDVCRTIGKDTIEAWNVPEHLREAAEKTGGKTTQREEHLSSIKWYGPEEKEKLLWTFNEKFCWC